jgi:hypothetical protein
MSGKHPKAGIPHSQREWLERVTIFRRPEVCKVREGSRAAGACVLSERPVWGAASSNGNGEVGRVADLAAYLKRRVKIPQLHAPRRLRPA